MGKPTLSIPQMNPAVDFFFPKGAGPFPVVIFSHGGLVPVAAYYYLGEFWSRHGYVTAHVHHSKSRDVDTPSGWATRHRDLVSAIGSLSDPRRLPRRFRNKLDLDRIGVAGHSYGAQSTLVLAGARLNRARHDQTEPADPRIKAFLALSPPGPGSMGLTERSLARVSSPLLLVTGSLDKPIRQSMRTKVRRDDQPRWRASTFAAIARGDKYHLVIKGADHYSFLDALIVHEDRIARPDKRVFQDVCRTSLLFWDAYLRHKTRAMAVLRASRRLHKR